MSSAAIDTARIHAGTDSGTSAGTAAAPAQAGIGAPAPDLRLALSQGLPDSFASLGPDFYTRVVPRPLPHPVMVGFSVDAAGLLGYHGSAAHALARDAAVLDLLAGNGSYGGGGRTAGEVPSVGNVGNVGKVHNDPAGPPADQREPGPASVSPNPDTPYASVYSGHQFGVWAGQLGDGRALTLGEVAGGAAPRGAPLGAPHDAPEWQNRQEVQLKGAGLTPYSRMGDGRAVLRSSIREYLCSEAMHHLGVPTTRALCVVGSDYPVRREEIETAAVVTRLAPSFVRFGHFEHFFSIERHDLLARLADHVIARFYPACAQAEDPYLALLASVTARTAELIAQWQSFGFCHGVMNTDNMSILGLTIDYGPFGFLDGYDPRHICNHSDSQGRYSYQQQPQAAYWNLFCLGRALLPLIGRQRGAAGDERALQDAHAALETYKDRFVDAREARMRAKLGLADPHDGDALLIDRLLELMAANRVDFTLTFRNLGALEREPGGSGDAPARDLFLDRPGFDVWAAAYRERLALESRDDVARRTAMDQVNPKYVLRNHLAETAIRAAREGDFSELARLADVLSRPFDEQPQAAAYAALPPSWATELSVSCSS